MFVIILAAGQGRRLSPLTDACPKCLLSLQSSTFLQFQVNLVRQAGLDNIAVVTGFCADQVRQCLGDSVTYVHNEDFQTTNSLYSFMLTEQVSREGCLVMNSDVVFHPQMMQKLLATAQDNALLVDFDAELGEEEMKVLVDEQGSLQRISKDLTPWEAHGENLGIVRMGAEATQAVLAEARDAAAADQLNLWLPEGVQRVLDRQDFQCVSIDKQPWIEVDYCHDLTRAQKEIYPLCCENPPS